MKTPAHLAALINSLPPAYWLLWVGTLINRLGGLIVPFLTLYLTARRGILPVAICTFLVGFFTDLYRPAVSAAVSDLVAPALRTRAYGYLYWAINLGAAVAPVEAAYHAAHTGMRERLSRLKAAPVLLLFSFLTLVFGIVYAQSTVTLPLDMAALSHHRRSLPSQAAWFVPGHVRLRLGAGVLPWSMDWRGDLSRAWRCHALDRLSGSRPCAGGRVPRPWKACPAGFAGRIEGAAHSLRPGNESLTDTQIGRDSCT